MGLALQAVADQTTESLIAESAYLIFTDSSMAHLLRLKERGLKVQVLTNSLAANNNTINHQRKDPWWWPFWSDRTVPINENNNYEESLIDSTTEGSNKVAIGDESVDKANMSENTKFNNKNSKFFDAKNKK